MADDEKQSLIQQALDKRNEWAAKQPSFTGQLAAMGREGLKDLQNAILPAFPESQHGVEEPGTPLNPTPQQVTKALEVEPSYEEMLGAYAPPSTPAVQKETEMER